jgi:hypothetical protein
MSDHALTAALAALKTIASVLDYDELKPHTAPSYARDIALAAVAAIDDPNKDTSIQPGDRIEYQTTAGFGTGNMLTVVVLAHVPKRAKLSSLMLFGRKAPSGVSDRSPNERYIVRVLKKNGEPVKGAPLKFPNASTLKKGTQL